MRLPALHGARRLALGLAAAMVLLRFFPAAPAWLDWNRVAIEHGQWHRLLSAHLVHLNRAHLVMNLLALFALAEIFWHELPARTAAALLAASSVGVGLGLVWIEPDLWHCAGLSGVLHGAWAGSALMLLQQDGTESKEMRAWWALALLALAAKLAMENFLGLRLAQASMGVPVVLPSHALGALAGVVFAGLACLAKRIKRVDGSRPTVASPSLFD